jgi:hypothetical protein
MQSGKILVAHEGGAFVIKLIGDVRLTIISSACSLHPISPV